MRFLFVLFLLFYSSCLIGQEEFRVVFYNTENLYDTIRNEKINDEEFTPSGYLHWSTYRYNRKIESTAQVLSSMGDSYPPTLIGLCEVENDNVVHDLLSSINMQRHNYRFVMTNSKDARGSNIAFLYQRDQFRLISKRTYRPKLEDLSTTRDILHVCGEVVSGDTLDIFICHFPSRLGGIKKSDSNRISVASSLYKEISKVLKNRSTPRIIIMGDFNDQPDGKVFQYLQDKAKKEPNLFTNLMDCMKNDSVQSYYYQGKWLSYDQFIVSENMLDTKSNCYVNTQKAYVFSPNYLLDVDDKYNQKKPFRTFSGWTYLGGYSDHLPIYLNLFIKE